MGRDIAHYLYVVAATGCVIPDLLMQSRRVFAVKNISRMGLNAFISERRTTRIRIPTIGEFGLITQTAIGASQQHQ